MSRFVFAILTAVMILMVCMTAWAVPTAVLNVPSEGDHFYWFTYTGIDGTSVTTSPRRFKDKTATIELPLVKDAVVKSDLYVFDAKTGNEAVVPIPPKGTGAADISLKSSDFDHIRRVEVVVKSSASEEPAAAAIVTLEIDGKKQTQMIDPSSSGSVFFTDVPSGTSKITVNYGAGKSSSQDMDLALDRKEVVPVIEVPVVGDIETIQAPVPSADTADQPSSRRTAGGKPVPVESDKGPGLFTGLLGIILLAGAGYAAFIVLKNKGVAVRGLLKKAGIDLPEDKPQTQAPQNNGSQQIVVDPSVCQFCGGKKDPVTGACACSVGSGVSPVAGTSSEPRLIANMGAYSGSIFTLAPGTTTIGRDESNTIAFPMDNTVSRRHSRIENSGGSITVYDEGSSNGTFVNGVKITEQVLRPGDEVQVGSTRLRFEA